MAAMPVDVLRTRADVIGDEVTAAGGPVVASGPCNSVTGGGTLPGVEIPSWGVHLDGDRAAALRRTGPTPIVATVRDGATHLDLRTVDPADDRDVTTALISLARV
jgi:L-seryl-tRNA(Ser) seleniumtransferase